MTEAVYESIDKGFRHLIYPTAHVEELYSGCRWAEGPVWFSDLDCLLFSDIPNKRILRWIEGGGVSTYRQPSNFANGNTRDAQGRLISCEHGTRRVTRTEYDGSITILADSYNNKRFNSPNDVVVKSDGTIWFTDPTYGIMADYEGYTAEPEQETRNVYCLDPKTGHLNIAVDDFVQPNGLAFSPDETKLYIADSSYSHDENNPRHIRVFDVGENNRLTGGSMFYETDVGLPDGFRLDVQGNIWTSAGDGVHCVDAGGTLLGKIRIPQVVANVAFGGVRKNRLFITATTSLYSVYLAVNGCQKP